MEFFKYRKNTLALTCWMDDIYELYFLNIFDSIIFTLIIYKTL